MKGIFKKILLFLLFLFLFSGCQTTDLSAEPGIVYLTSNPDISQGNEAVFATRPEIEEEILLARQEIIINQLGTLPQTDPRFAPLLVEFANNYKIIGDNYKEYADRLENYLTQIQTILNEGEK